MMKRILALVLCLTMIAGMVPAANALPVKVEQSSRDRCCQTLRVNPLDVNYVRPNYDGMLIDITPQRVADTFAYLDEHYVKNHPEQALDVYTGTEEDRAILLKLAETITADCATDKQKADAIDRWLYRNIYYDINTSAYAYDTFYNRTGNCLSYANLMQFLLRSLGIPAVVGDGWRGDMKTSTVDLFNYEGHAWCFVYLEGEWVLYDPLWIECGTTDRDYIAEWIYLDTVEFITPASDGDNLPPEAWDKPKVYYTDGRWYNFDSSHPTGYGNFTMLVNNQSYNFTPCQDEGALGLDGGYDGWYILDGKNDKSGMQLGEVYRNSWLSYGEYEGGSYLNLTYAHPNGMQIDGAIMEYNGVERYMQCNNSFPVLAEEEDYTMQYGCLAFKPGYVGPFVAPSWGSLYDSDFYIVTWESDTPEVCTVDENGILTAVAPGFAQVRLTLSDQEGGGYYCITNINVCVSDEERIPQLDSPTASGVCGESLTWELTDGVLTISGTGAMYDYAYMEAPWCPWLEEIRQIVIQDGVTRIGENAFREAMNVTAVSLSDSITEIGSWVFMNMEKLAAVTLPRNLTYLGQEAFMNCIALQEIELPGTLTFIDAAICTGCTSLARAVFHGDPDIPSFVMGNSPFRYCTALEAIEVDGEHICLKTVDGVLYTYSGDQLSVMQYPAGRREPVWNIPEGTVDIGQLAAEQAQYLEEVSIPDTVYEIWPFAFSGCKSLRSVSFAGDAPVIQEYAFSGVEADITYPAGNETWTDDVMQQYGGTITWVPVDDIPDNSCGENVTWNLENGTLTISGTGAMTSAPWLQAHRDEIQTVIIEEGVTAIADYAFRNCVNLESVSFPAGMNPAAIRPQTAQMGATLKTIGEGAFLNCSGLTEITLPASVTDIGDGAFMYCTGLEQITFTGDAPTLGEDCFGEVEATVTYPEDNDTWTEEVQKNYGGNLTWEIQEKEVYTAEWKSATTSLNGTIDLNIYVVLSENLMDEEDAFVRFTYANKVVDVPIAEGIESVSGGILRYRYSCPMYAKEVSQVVTVQVMKGDEVIGSALEYSIVTYCMNRINKSTNPAQVELCKALLNYAAAAQISLGYNVENLANAELDDADKVLPDGIDVSGYKSAVTGSETGIKAKSATLMLESEVSVRVYFTLEEGYSIDDFAFTIDGKVVQPQKNNTGWFIETDGIAAKNLDQMMEFSVGGLTVTYGPMSYVNSKLGVSNEDTVNLARALYAYWQAAEALLG